MLLAIMSFVIIILSGERTSIGLFILSFLFIFISSQKFRKLFYSFDSNPFGIYNNCFIKRKN